jgi:hypothetical protein
VSVCETANTWTPISGGGSIPSTFQVLMGDNAGNAAASGITKSGSDFTFPGKTTASAFETSSTDPYSQKVKQQTSEPAANADYATLPAQFYFRGDKLCQKIWTGTSTGTEVCGLASQSNILAAFTGSGDYLKSDGSKGTPPSATSPALIARTITTTVGSGNTDIDSVTTTIDAGKCVRVQAHWENLTGSVNADIYLNLDTTAWQLSTGVTGAGMLNGMICNAAGVQNSQVVYGSVGIGAWYGNSGAIKTTSSVDVSTAKKISISANGSQQMRMNWLVERLF